MLGWLAVHAELASIQDDLERRSKAALAAAGHGWASVAFDGRDGLLVGQGVSARDREKALAIVRGIWGVHSVRTRLSPDATGIADLPIKPAMEAPVDSTALGDVLPAPAGELPPSAAARAHAAQATLVAVLPPAQHVVAYEAALDVMVRPAPPTSVAAASTAPGDKAVPSETSVPTTVGKADDGPASDAPKAEPRPATPLPGIEPTLPAPEQKAAVAEPAAVPHDAEAAAGGVRAPLPVQKQVAQPQAMPVAKAAGAPETKPPAAAPAPRFETAALPPGNIASNATCVSDVKAAAQRVEVHFARGDARLDTQGKGLIDGLAASLSACAEVALHIAGHADASGQRRHNAVLSRRRANSVVAYLVDKGIDAGRLVAVGYGDKQPVAPNNTGANRAKNRRIELSVAARKAPLPPMPIPKQGTRNGLSHR